ncbi:hypothetical protein D3C85_1652040 [compost metagenome]
MVYAHPLGSINFLVGHAGYFTHMYSRIVAYMRGISILANEKKALRIRKAPTSRTNY